MKKSIFILITFLSSALSAQIIPFSFWGAKSASLSYSTTAQSLYAGNCSSVVTVQTKNASGAVANVASNLTISLSATNGASFYSDPGCQTSIASVVVTTGTSSASFYVIGGSAGANIITSTATGYAVANQTETVTTNPFIWTGGAGDNIWSTATNWSGGAAPSSTSHYALFDGTSCSISCSPTISASINIGGVRINSAYAGTITQAAGQTITLAAQGWVQAAGTFVGGNSAITMNGSFILTGGTFTSTSNTFTAIGKYWTIAGGTFDASTGTVYFNHGAQVITPGAGRYNKVTFNSWGGTFELGGNTINIDGLLTLTSSNVFYINSGTLASYGDVSMAGFGCAGNVSLKLLGNASGQTFTGVSGAAVPYLEIDAGANNVTLVGQITLGKSYKVTSVGTLTTTGSTLELLSASSSTLIYPGTAHYNNVSIPAWGAGFDFGGATFYIDGNLTFGSANTSTVTDGIFAVKGNVTVSGSAGSVGNAQIQYVGTSTQTLTVTTGATLPTGNVTVNNTGGLQLGSNVSFNSGSQVTTVTSGGINMAGYNLTVKSLVLSGTTVTKNTGTLTVNSVVAGTGSLYGGTVDP